ncbi:MAG: UvrD-helicase domain-containing protein, partial [Candidatus Woesearchaeota archaeon]
YKKEIIKKKIYEIKNHFKNTNYADYSDQEKKFIKIENILKEIKSIKDEYKEIYNISFSYLDKTTNKYFELLIQYREENNLFLFYKEIINNAYSELDKLEDKYKKVVDEDKYLIDSEGKKLSEESSISLSLIESYINDEKIKHSDVIKLLKEYETKIIKVSEKINNFNYNFVEEKKIEYKDLFNKDIPLDEHQKEAIIKDDKHNLVVAGAGSGKTEVLIKRIAYLIERKSDKIKPERIIALAFQNKAEDEIKNRLKERYNLKVDIKTFHSLGFDILKKAKKDYKLKFSGDNHEDKYNKFIKKIINQLKQKSEFQNKLINYMKYFDDNEEILDEEKFEEKEEFYNYMKNLRFTTLDKTKVKSKAEREIMNFFLTHKFNGEKIRIIYEHPATWMKESKESKIDIKPDFFFPKFNLYIEHWGIDKNGNPPPWFEGYKESMEYKKNQFKNQDKFKLIETFQWEYDEKILIKNLISKFEKIAGQKLKIEPIPYEELVKQVWEDCKQSVKSIDYSVSKFIRIAKTYDLSIDDIKNIMNENLKTEKQISFYDIAIDVYKKYEDILKKENRIDFNDMINLAIKELEINKNLFYNKIDHILIDEYQDISKQRYLLIKKLIERNNNCKLFCVGDDWQSIMGFTGSNLDYFVNFDKYFNNPCKTDLPINYRSIKSIVDTGKEIIKNNGEIQLFKETIAKNDKIKKIKIYSIHSHENNYFKYIVQKSLLKIKELIKKGYKNSDILILTRITKEQKLKENLEIYSSEYNIPINIEGNTPKGIPYMSIHKSKGLQAKAVIILNMRDHLYGFPCKIEDSELFKPLNQENHYIGLPEERRLFYVAVTRAKEEVYIYTHKYYESQFIKEINEYVEKEYL